MAAIPLGFTELYASLNEDWDNEQGKGEFQRIFLGPWENKLAFIKILLGSVTTIDGQTVATSPVHYPDVPNAFAYKVNVKGKLGVNTTSELGLIKYEKCLITVNYKTVGQGTPVPRHDDDGSEKDNKIDFAVEESGDTSTEIIPLEGVTVAYDIGIGDYRKFPIKAIYKLTIFHYKIRYKQYYIPQEEMNRLIDALGKINEGQFKTQEPSDWLFEEGAVLFESLTFNTRYNFNDLSKIFDVTFGYGIHCTNVSWNHYPIVKKQGGEVKLSFEIMDPLLYEYTELPIAKSLGT